MSSIIHINSSTGVAERLLNDGRVSLLGNLRTNSELTVLNEFLEILNGATPAQENNFNILFSKALNEFKKVGAANINIEASTNLQVVNGEKVLKHSFNIKLGK